MAVFNLLVIGQSNAQEVLASVDGTATTNYEQAIAASAAADLNTSASNISVVGKAGNEADDATSKYQAISPGTAFSDTNLISFNPTGSQQGTPVADDRTWLTSSNGTFSDDLVEQNLDGYLNSTVSGAVKGIPTIVLQFHNESDGLTVGDSITSATWEAALKYQESDIASVLGGPVIFGDVNVPSDFNNQYSNSGNTDLMSLASIDTNASSQNIAAAQYALSVSSPSNFFVAAQARASNMTTTMETVQGGAPMPAVNGGQHFSSGDLDLLVKDIGESVAKAAASYFGKSITLDTLGPQITSATAIAGHPNQLLVSLTTSSGTTLSLPSGASSGAGFNIHLGSGFSDGPGILRATSASLSGSQVTVTFTDPIPTDGSGLLYYGSYGDNRIDTSFNSAGENTAIIGTTSDGRTLSAWETPAGLSINTVSGGIVGVTAASSILNTSADTDSNTETISLISNQSATITSSTLDDLVYGSNGSLNFTGGSSLAQLAAGQDAGLYTGANGDISLSGADTIVASSGPVTVNGSTGKVTVYGSSGSLSVTGGTQGLNVINAGSGNATLIGANNVSVAGGIADAFYGSTGQALVELGNASDSISLGSGKSTVAAASGTDAINLGNGADTVYLGSGKATVSGSTGTGTGEIVDGSGISVIQGQTSANNDIFTYFGGTGSSTVYGQAHNGDAFDAQGEKMYLVEGSGNTSAEFGTNNSTIYGGSGADYYQFVYGSEGASDAVSGFKVGTDLIQLGGYAAHYGSGVVNQVVSSEVVSGGNTTVTLPDNTKVLFYGVSGLSASNFSST